MTAKLQYANNINIVYFNKTKYTKTNINYNFGTLKEITLYINYNTSNNNDCINLTYTGADKEYVDNDNPTYVEHTEIIKDPYNSQIDKHIRVIDKISIICNINVNSSLNEVYLMVRHELIHILHEIEKSIINIRAGNAYYYVDKICNYYNLDFPDKEVLTQININSPSDKELIQIFGGCLYYLDTSEYSAWLDSYYV